MNDHDFTFQFHSLKLTAGSLAGFSAQQKPLAFYYTVMCHESGHKIQAFKTSQCQDCLCVNVHVYFVDVQTCCIVGLLLLSVCHLMSLTLITLIC